MNDMTLMSWNALYRSMEERWRPEDVAAGAVEFVPSLRGTILARYSRGAWLGTSRWERYGRPGFRGHQVDFSIVDRYPGLLHDPAATVALLTQQTGLETNDLRDRLPAPMRRQAGITISRRQYAKQCRILLALRRKIDRIVERGSFVRWTRIALSGWALDITLTDFMAMTPETRVFVAYYVARRQRQSVFSGSGQDPAWDEVSAKLFKTIEPHPAIALAFPDPRILVTLTDDQRAALLIAAYRELLAMAQTLRDLWEVLRPDAETMVVRRGMNSSDWNAVAGAWNAIRSLWVGLLYACGRESDLDAFCPGKVMRLMAADVAQWHKMLGEDEGPDVKLFKVLPRPWDVVLGRATCARADVVAAQLAARIKKDTWTKAATVGKPVPTRPTHAMVHGVAVSDPALASVLRRAGWFSGGQGKLIDRDVEVLRDEYGFALGASESTESVAQR